VENLPKTVVFSFGKNYPTIYVGGMGLGGGDDRRTYLHTSGIHNRMPNMRVKIQGHI
jgi:hypothetical protein